MRRVLIVEDIEGVRKALVRLGRSQGWEMLEARDGVEALEIVDGSERCPDLILLDFSMPKMDGMSLLRHLGEGSHRAAMRAVMYTAIADPIVHRRALDLGAHDVIYKASLDWEQLATRLEQCMASPAGDPRPGPRPAEDQYNPFRKVPDYTTQFVARAG